VGSFIPDYQLLILSKQLKYSDSFIKKKDGEKSKCKNALKENVLSKMGLLMGYEVMAEVPCVSGSVYGYKESEVEVKFEYKCMKIKTMNFKD
jgi:hypothetical protein